MREVTVLRWCDACSPTRAPAEYELVLQATGGPTAAMRLDLCPACWPSVSLPEMVLLAKTRGVPPEAEAETATRSRSYPTCPQCGHPAGNLRKHCLTAHGLDIADRLERRGDLYLCPQDGCAAEYGSYQAVAQHFNRAHDSTITEILIGMSG